MLAGVVVKNEDWRAIETSFDEAIEAIVPRSDRCAGWELAATAGQPEPPEWTRLAMHLDTLDDGKRVGFKIWPP